jgi:hypothetical protein
MSTLRSRAGLTTPADEASSVVNTKKGNAGQFGCEANRVNLPLSRRRVVTHPEHVIPLLTGTYREPVPGHKSPFAAYFFMNIRHNLRMC